MAVGDTQYGQYGLTEIDSYSSSTYVSSIDIDINDTSENNTLILVQGTLQNNTDGVNIRFQYLDSSDTIMSNAFRTMTGGTTSTSWNNNTTRTHLNSYTAGNANNTSYDPIVVGAACEMLDFEMLVSSERSSSAPIRNVFVVGWSVFYSTGAFIQNPQFSSRCFTDSACPTLRFTASSGNIAGKIKSYALCAKT